MGFLLKKKIGSVYLYIRLHDRLSWMTSACAHRSDSACHPSPNIRSCILSRDTNHFSSLHAAPNAQEKNSNLITLLSPCHPCRGQISSSIQASWRGRKLLMSLVSLSILSSNPCRELRLIWKSFVYIHKICLRW